MVEQNKIALIENPIFLVGAERSGTTVLRLMLKHHPQITWCNEFEYVVDRLPMDSGFPSLELYYEWLDTHRVFRATGFTIDRTLSYPELVNDFLIQKREHDHKPIVGATIHRHFDQVLRIWPDARFIHLIRDGRDVARSCIGMGWAGNVWTGVSRWTEAEQLWDQLKQSLSSDRYIDVTYEDLITDPPTVLTRLCQFIGVTYDPAMLNYAKNSTYDTPDPKFIGQWRRKLSDREIQLVESRARSLLTARGYELSGLPPLMVDPILQKQLNVQDWLVRLQFRLKRNGLALTAADYLSRKLGLIQWQKQVKLRMNEITTAHLK